MSEPFEKQLFEVFAAAWGEAVPSVLGCSTSLSLLSQREVMGDEVKAALAPTRAFSVVFGAKCFGELSGVLLCLFKKEDNAELASLINSPGGRAFKPVMNAALEATATRLEGVAAAPTTFGEVTSIELPESNSVAHLAKGAGEWVWVNSFTLMISESLSSEMMVLYAPQGSLEVLQTVTMSAANAAPPALEMAATAVTSAASAGPVIAPARGRSNVPLDDASRNMERLLDVELEVVVRFGLTNIPLRELVRIGVGSMIELNRQVDEPVELLVNNRPLARGSVVVVDGYYGVCITEIGQLEERRMSLTKP